MLSSLLSAALLLCSRWCAPPPPPRAHNPLAASGITLLRHFFEFLVPGPLLIRNPLKKLRRDFLRAT